MKGAKPRFQVELSDHELLELALWLERCGGEFYRFLAEDQKNSKLRNFFLRLVGMEMEHENQIRSRLASLGPTEPTKLAFDETLTGREYFLRLKKLCEGKLFPVDINFITDLERFIHPRDALPLVINTKEQSIRLYRLLLGFQLTGEARRVAEGFIVEGEKHLAQIQVILKSLG